MTTPPALQNAIVWRGEPENGRCARLHADGTLVPAWGNDRSEKRAQEQVNRAFAEMQQENERLKALARAVGQMLTAVDSSDVTLYVPGLDALREAYAPFSSGPGCCGAPSNCGGCANSYAAGIHGMPVGTRRVVSRPDSVGVPPKYDRSMCFHDPNDFLFCDLCRVSR